MLLMTSSQSSAPGPIKLCVCSPPASSGAGGSCSCAKTGEVLGTVETAAAQAAEKVAAIQFELDEQQQRRLLVQELA